MKKQFLLITILLSMTLSACSYKSTGEADSDIGEKQFTETGSTEVSHEEEVVVSCAAQDSIEPITSVAAEWAAALNNTGELKTDLNMDKQEDLISLANVSMEGSRLISKFEVAITGCENNFMIENYDASLEKLELFDFDKDETDELIIMFDTHGGGGQGTHDIYILWFKDNCMETTKLDTAVEPANDVDVPYNIDGVYSIEKVLYDGQEKMLTRQYTWGDEGHADSKGDLVSIVTLNVDKSRFIAEESWMEE